jgi:inorganic triphosphatase YgiF
MEVELKLAIPDAATFQHLRAVSALGDYTVKEPVTKTVTDTYLDTATRLLWHNGYACRIRHNHTNDQWLGTIKGLGNASAGFHQREEFEIEIPADTPPDAWPNSPARDLALSLAQSQPFIKLFSIRQIRHISLICLRDLVVAEWSLDEVSFVADARKKESLELEIELKEQGTLADLRVLNASLTDFDLQPEPLSKFERGLRLLKT